MPARRLLVLAAALALLPSAHAQFLGAAPETHIAPVPGVQASPETVQTLLTQQRPPFLIGPGDALQVQLYEVERYDYKTRTDSKGSISLPLVDEVNLLNLTTEQAETLIAHRLEDLGMVKNPHLHVTITEQPSQTFTVAGDVEKPGLYASFAPHTLLAAVSQAGGFKETASRSLTLLRPGAPQGYILNLGPDPANSPAANIPVFRGDVVVVGSVGVLYVVGAVKLAGVFKLKTTSATTVLEAVSMAGGAGFEAQTASAEIVRNKDGQRIELPINLKRIAQGADPDPILQADDIVLIPSSALKAAIKGGGANVAVSLATAAILR